MRNWESSLLAICLCLSSASARGAELADASRKMSAQIALVASGALSTRLFAEPSAVDDRMLATALVERSTDALARCGVTPLPLSPHVAAFWASAADLTCVAALEATVRIEERRLLVPLLDRSGPSIHAPEARARHSIDGSGVLAAVIDTGLDLTHVDVRDALGRTRVEALLDRSQPANPAHADLDFGGGIWFRDEIDASFSGAPIPSHDTNGHGSHVAGIVAAGGGRYLGIAPGASLLVVQTSPRNDARFSDVDVLTAMRFCIARADALARPLVVNISLGGGGGPHDGSTTFERAIDELFPANAAGRVLVAAAGNAGLRDTHARAYEPSGSHVMSLFVRSSQEATGAVTIDLFASSPAEITVVDPAGRRYGPLPVAFSGSTPESANGRVVLYRNGADATIVLLGPSDAPPSSGTYRIELSGAARYDAWISNAPKDAPARFSDHVSPDTLLELPASGQAPIVVGAYSTRSTWTTPLGEERSLANVTLDGIARFSSSGPTRDGRFSPDVVAPGELIASIASIDAPVTLESSVFYSPAGLPDALVEDGLHGVLRGTSQSAPHVAGAIALLLQAAPSLTTTAVREILRVTARPGAYAYSPHDGFGRIDVAAALSYVRGTRGDAVDRVRSRLGTSRDAVVPGQDEFVITLTPRDAFERALGPGHRVEISATEAQALDDTRDLGFGRYERRFLAPKRRGAIAVISATVDEQALDATLSVYAVESRAEIGRAFVATGGCAQAPGSPASDSHLTMSTILMIAASYCFLRRRPKKSPSAMPSEASSAKTTPEN